jgi:rubrerythrin
MSALPPGAEVLAYLICDARREMNLRDVLAKLGILRFGTKKAVWHSGRDMPAEMLMDDVFNAERDLTTKKDMDAVREALTGADCDVRQCARCGRPLPSGQKVCPVCGAPKPHPG